MLGEGLSSNSSTMLCIFFSPYCLSPFFSHRWMFWYITGWVKPVVLSIIQLSGIVSNFLQTCIGHDLRWVKLCMQHQEVHRLGSHALSFSLQSPLVFAMSIPFFHWMIRCAKVLRKEHAVITRKHDSSLKFCNTLTIHINLHGTCNFFCFSL